METVTISQKFQVVIPLKLRREMRLKPGVKMVVLKKDGILHMMPVGELKKARGIAKGVVSKGIRDETERFS